MAKAKSIEKEKEVAAVKPVAVPLKVEEPAKAVSGYSNHPKMAKFKTQETPHND